ncbi:MAG TPA: PAS domain-containing sensor histidine kinase [Flavobacteriaceae bacterium]|nr:PAS domain-containing sensor histidine kinase [Flavobacteriaceae bacterium]
MKFFDAKNRLGLEPFFSLSHDYLCIAGYDGYFRKVNPAFIKLMGYEQPELFARSIHDFIHPEDQAKTAANRAQLLEEVPLLHFENRYVTKSGEIAWLTWTSVAHPAEKLVYAIAKNITHKKKLEEERQFMIRDLTSKNSGLKQYTYTIVHDLRTPISNMISLFGLLDPSKIQDKETLLYLELLEKSVHELKNTLNDQVDHLKNNLLLKSNLEQVNLKEIFDTTTGSISSLIKVSKTSFVIDFSEFEMLVANNFYLQSVFLNLITNSIKYSKPGTPPVITIVSKKEKDGLQIRFSDNGIGFDMEKNKDKLFGLNQVFTNHNDSKGIGLFLVKNHMDNLGGSIEVTSQLGIGSTFFLNFKN